MWGPYTSNRFASSRTKKLKRFNSLFWNPGSESVDYFCQNLRDENNRLVWIIKAIKYLVSLKILQVVPYHLKSEGNICIYIFIFHKNKKRLIFDLSFLNAYIKKEHIKFDKLESRFLIF